MKALTFIAVILLFACSEGKGQTQTSFWTNSTVPATTQATDDSSSVTLGLRFTSDVPGSVLGVRFYKGPKNTGTHTGNLWTGAGAKLAAVTFSNETASGWQQAMFATPVSIVANGVYVISYTAPRGNYAYNVNMNWTNVVSGPLRASGTAAGVFKYGSSAAFPTESWNKSNYWVDVIFAPAAAPAPNPTPTTYTISGNVRGSAAQLTLSGPKSASAVTDASGNYSFAELPNGLYVVAASQSGYTFSPTTASVTINNASISGTNFVATANPVPVPRSVTLSWAPSSSSNLRGYHVYRADVAGGAFAKLTASAVTNTSFVDGAVTSGRIYYYVATAVDTNGAESEYSNQATAVIPTP